MWLVAGRRPVGGASLQQKPPSALCVRIIITSSAVQLQCAASMDMEIPSILSEHWEIINLGDISGTFADGIPLAGSKRAPWLLGKPSAYAPQRPLQGRPPPCCSWHHPGFNHLRARGPGTGITPRALHCRTLPRIYSLRRRRRGAGLTGLLTAMGIPGGST